MPAFGIIRPRATVGCEFPMKYLSEAHADVPIWEKTVGGYLHGRVSPLPPRSLWNHRVSVSFARKIRMTKNLEVKI
jgi:hypothetical protein